MIPIKDEEKRDELLMEAVDWLEHMPHPSCGHTRYNDVKCTCGLVEFIQKLEEAIE